VAPSSGHNVQAQSHDSRTATESPPIDQKQQHQAGVIAKGHANMDLAAQIPDELSFCNGDIIEITQVVDSDFAVGNCCGKSGSFPLAFVDIFEGSIDVVGKKEKRNSKFDWWKEVKSNGDSVADLNSSVVTDHSPKQTLTTHDEPGQEQAERDIQAMDVYPADTHRHIAIDDAYVPPIINDSHLPIKSHKRSDSYNQQNTYSQGEGGITPYGKTLFPFVGENPNELTVFDNEIVTLVRHVDDQWIEGEIDGKRGIFPLSYVEIIVDCPYDYGATPQKESVENTQELSNLVQSTKKPAEVLEDNTFGCVLYDFNAEMSGDLDLHEGDTIKLLTREDDDWYTARSDDGRVGMCPVAYVELIPEEPPVILSSPNVTNGYETTQQTEERIATNNNVTKLENKRSSISPDKPRKPAKPAIRGPKPSLKPKPQLKSVSFTSSPTDGGTCNLGRSVSVDSCERDSPPVRPPRPTSVVNKQMSLSSSLDDIIQKELGITKRDLGTINEPKPTLHNLAQAMDGTSPKSPSFVEMESSTLSVSFNSSLPDSLSMTSSSAVLSRPPAIPATKRLSGPPKRTPPPRPHTHPTPQSLPLEPVAPLLGPRIVPQRAAPPRPCGAPIPAPRRKRSGDNLMEFSPEEAEAPAFCGK
jgi:hypothetical protein